MSQLVIKNWKKFQHYKDRNPPWIKLATNTFQDYEFSKLSDASKLLALCYWTLAARESGVEQGAVPDDLQWVKNQCSLGDLVTDENVQELIDKGFITRASKTLASCKQSASLEERRGEERERQTRGEGKLQPKKTPSLAKKGEEKTDDKGIASVSAISSQILSSFTPEVSKPVLLPRLMALGDPESYELWWRAVLNRMETENGLTVVYDALQKAERNENPQLRESRGEGIMDAPSRYVAGECKTYLAQFGKTLPKAPAKTEAV